jgi:hypothetical protein
VQLSDDMALPFEDFMDHSLYSLKIPSNQLDSLISILQSVAPAEIQSKEAMIPYAQQLFSWNNPSEHCDAFQMLELELAFKLPRFKNFLQSRW